MKKLFIVYSFIVLASSAINLQAFDPLKPLKSDTHHIWGVNLTDKEQNFRYTANNKTYYFDVAPLSVSDGRSSKGWHVYPVGHKGLAKNADLTFIAYGTKTHPSDQDFERTSPKKSKKLEEIVAKNFGGKKPADVLKNWNTFKQ